MDGIKFPRSYKQPSLRGPVRFLVPLLIVAGFICSPGPDAWADDALDWYLKGNELSRKGQLEQAVDAYHTIPMPRDRFTIWAWPTSI